MSPKAEFNFYLWLNTVVGLCGGAIGAMLGYSFWLSALVVLAIFWGVMVCPHIFD